MPDLVDIVDRSNIRANKCTTKRFCNPNDETIGRKKLGFSLTYVRMVLVSRTNWPR